MKLSAWNDGKECNDSIEVANEREALSFKVEAPMILYWKDESGSVVAGAIFKLPSQAHAAVTFDYGDKT